MDSTTSPDGVGGYRALVVDDEAALADVVASYLRRENFEVHLAHDGTAALTTARERGVDIIDLQDFAGHADPRTTLAYIRSRDRLSKSPAYVLKY